MIAFAPNQSGNAKKAVNKGRRKGVFLFGLQAFGGKRLKKGNVKNFGKKAAWPATAIPRLFYSKPFVGMESLLVQWHSHIAFLAGFGAKALVIKGIALVVKQPAALKALSFNRVIVAHS